jgi:hypothetical protein
MMKYDLATEDYTTGIKLFKVTVRRRCIPRRQRRIPGVANGGLITATVARPQKDRKENKKMLASGYYHRGQARIRGAPQSARCSRLATCTHIYG